jgi:hypothetical protein
MNELNRRNLLKTLLGGALSAVGSVVLARATLAASSQNEEASASENLQERADRLAHDADANSGELEPIAFLNRAFRNGGGFRNGGFRNGGFVNGGFRNGGFVNGGFRNWRG